MKNREVGERKRGLKHTLRGPRTGSNHCKYMFLVMSIRKDIRMVEGDRVEGEREEGRGKRERG